MRVRHPGQRDDCSGLISQDKCLKIATEIRHRGLAYWLTAILTIDVDSFATPPLWHLNLVLDGRLFVSRTGVPTQDEAEALAKGLVSEYDTNGRSAWCERHLPRFRPSGKFF